mgnify:CR=1 FL=1
MINITDIRIKPALSSVDRLRAFCSITIDYSFVVKDIKIIEGDNGLFVAMPNRKKMFCCPNCSQKNHIQAHFCNNCGTPIHFSNETELETNIYLDIVHPLTSECRESLQEKIIDAFNNVKNQIESKDFTQKIE